MQIKLLFLTLNINYSKILFFHPNLQSVTSLSTFKKNLLKFIRPSPNSEFNCHNCEGIKCLTRPHLDLSHLHEHKFKHSFQDTLNPFCLCGLDVETNTFSFFTSPCLIIKDTPS